MELTKTLKGSSSSSYCSLHNHTMFSNLHVIDSINKPEQMLDYAYGVLHLSGLAFTDHDTISGAVKFLKAYQAKLRKEWGKAYPETPFPTDYAEAADKLNFKVILGNEIYLSESDTCESNAKDRHFYHCILLAKDAEGFHQIRQISSEAWKRGWSNGVRRRTPTYSEDLFKYVKGGHLICSTACLAGFAARKVREILGYGNDDEVAKLDTHQQELRQDAVDSLNRHLAAMEGLFGKGNFYLELQPNGDGKDCDQNRYNSYRVQHYWGKYPFIFTTDAHYLKADLRGVHAAFLNSRSSKTRDVDEFYKYAYMRSLDEIYGYLSPYVTDQQFAERVDNTNKIKDRCTYYDLEQKKIIAKVQYEHFEEYEKDLEVFSDVSKDKYPDFYYYVHDSKKESKADYYLAELVAHGFIEHMKPSWNIEQYYARLQEEFWTIRSVGKEIQQPRSDYFISMAKMIQIIWDKAGSIVGPARGSAGVVLINYLIGITQMNPVERNLPYVWRFRHPSRPDLPDIDFDTESDKRAKVFLELQKYFRSIGGDVVNVCTFGTEGTKSAIKTAARGLDIDDSIVTYLTSLVPNERGFDWSLHDCYYGNNEDRKPIAAFVKIRDQNPRLWEVAQNIEGLITHLGVHASGILCLNTPLTDNGAFRKTNKNQLVTAYDLHDQEFCGLVKYDALTVSALDRIHQCRNYMLEDGTMKWQGSLKETYNHYLSPEVLDYTTPQRWHMVADGSIRSLFQFDTNMGSQGIALVHPQSLQQLATTNAVRRLRAHDGAELPLKKYAQFKSCPQLWYDERQECGLNADEIAIREKYLKDRFGIADTQEVIRQLVMDPHISNFDRKEANKLRKTVAKKNFRDIEGVKKLFYDKGIAAGTRKCVLDYVWDKQISRSLGYSFSAIHTSGYSLIAIQEMNLAYHYPIIYWNTACLSVDSSAINQADFYNLIDDDIIDATETVQGKKAQNKMDYAKIAAALDNFKKTCKIELPDINVSRLGFTPNAKDNTILYGLKGITKVTDPAINDIRQKRPFTSLQDFLLKRDTKVRSKDKVINLIKSGAFDKIEKKTTKEVLEAFVHAVCDQKQRVTMQNANRLIDYNLLPSDYSKAMEVYKLTKELRKHRDPNKLWYICDDELNIPAEKFDAWSQIIHDSGMTGYTVTIDGVSHRVRDSSQWDKYYKKELNDLSGYIKMHQSELLTKLNERLFQAEWDKYCRGDELDWELDSLNFYFTAHPLSQIIPQLPSDINIAALNTVVEGRQDGEFRIHGKIIPKRYLYTIAGTVIDHDKTKGLVTIQCPDGVVNLKLYKDLFATYNADLPDQPGFFEKGTHLLVTGIKRGPTFVPKVYKNTKLKSIEKILVDEQGHYLGLEEKKNAASELSAVGKEENDE